jgi:hypothetical protein
MSLDATIGALLCENETAFAENVVAYAERLPIIAPVDTSGLVRQKIVHPATRQYANDGTAYDIRGPFGMPTFSFTCHLTGHGVTSAGAVTNSVWEDQLGRVIGNADSDQAGTTIDTPADAGNFTLVGGTVSKHGIIFVGTLGDGDGEGQAYQMGVAANPTTDMLTDLKDTPVAAQVVLAATMFYPYETSDVLVTQRFCIMTANQRYNCHGCFPTAIQFNGLNAGEIPTVTITMACARFAEESAENWPALDDAVTAYSPSPVAAGSFWENALATTAYATKTIRDFQLNIDLGVIPLRGPGGVNAFQDVIGATRIGCKASYSYVTDAQAAGSQAEADLWDTAEDSYVTRHAIYTLSVGDKRSVAFCFPRAVMTGARPVQFDHDGINRIRSSYHCIAHGLATNALTNASWILALA